MTINRGHLITGILVVLFLAVVFVMALVPVTDGDTGYHLATGRYIIQHGTVPLYDIFGATSGGVRWVAHYWLSDVVMYAAYAAGGWWGLVVLVAIMAAATYGVLAATALRIGARRFSIYGALIFFSYFLIGIWSLWVARPQIFGFFAAALLVYALERWRISENRRWLWAGVFILWLWANLHASVILGIVLVATYVGMRILRHLKTPRLWVKEAAIMVIGWGATLVNPNGYKVITYGFDIAPIVKYIGIFEWQSVIAYLGPLGTPKAWLVFGFMCVVVGFVLRQIIHGAHSWKSIPWEWLALCGASIVMPLISVRHVGFFPIFAFPLFAWAASDLFSEAEKSYQHNRYALAGAAVVGLVFLCLGLARVPSTPIDQGQLPDKAADFIQANLPQGPLFNEISYGSYFVWRLWPQYKVFIDGRSEVYPYQVWEDFKTIEEYDPGWADVFEKYRFNTVVVSGAVPAPGEKVVRTDLILAYSLVRRFNFVLVYWDDASLVLVRNIPQNKGIIDRYGYKIIGPYNTPQEIPESAAHAAAQEIQRALQEAPGSKNLQMYAEAFLKSH